jgi:endogenous inhibitor of DNA gyrase (YacG/DUF329 family)
MSEKVKCPYCGRRVALTKTGRLWPHTDKETGNRCGRSGGYPN